MQKEKQAGVIFIIVSHERLEQCMYFFVSCGLNVSYVVVCFAWLYTMQRLSINNHNLIGLAGHVMFIDNIQLFAL